MKCGYVAVLGLPNAGKSSLTNFFVGEEVAIVSHRKQTTRNSILGILNGDDFQIIFVDTPGIHHSKNQLDKFMMKNVRSAIAEADVVLYLFDSSKQMEDEEIEYIENLKTKTPNLILVATKTDKGSVSQKISPDFEISVKTKGGTKELLDRIVSFLPERDALYDEELYTDKSVKFLVGEKIREYLLENLDKEIPHGIAVDIVSFFEDEDRVLIDADIICEREQHKGIVIGKGGKNLKELGIFVREYVEKLLEKKCVLKLFVKVDKDWRDKNTSQYGY